MTLAKSINALALAAITSFTALPGLHAHEDGDKGKAQHGGQYIMDEFHHGVEMVASDDMLAFHITEHLQPMDVTGGSFKAIVQTDSGTTIVPLEVNGDKLAGKLDGALPKGAKIALTGKDADGHAIQARFVKE